MLVGIEPGTSRSRVRCFTTAPQRSVTTPLTTTTTTTTSHTTTTTTTSLTTATTYSGPVNWYYC